MTRAQRRAQRRQALIDALQGFGVYLAAVLGVVARRFTFVYRSTGSVEGFISAWPEMLIAAISGVVTIAAIDSGGTAAGKRKRWAPRLLASFVAGLGADGMAGDIF